MSARRKSSGRPGGVPAAPRDARPSSSEPGADSYAAGAQPLPPRPRRMAPAKAPVVPPPAAALGVSAPPVLVWKEDDGRVRGARAGQEGALAALARGDLPMHGTLDLHGLTTAQAELELRRFFGRARGPHRRAVTVVHGKGTHSPGGRSVLREAIVLWLTCAPLDAAVLGFATARARDGGTGALYVLLAARR